jgi:hypothetical protein
MWRTTGSLLVRVNCCEPLSWPTIAPKLALRGASVTSASPEPVRVEVFGHDGALHYTVNVPLKSPTDSGLNSTIMVQEPPDTRIGPQVVPNTEKGGSGVVVILETVMLFDRPLQIVNPP